MKRLLAAGIVSACVVVACDSGIGIGVGTSVLEGKPWPGAIGAAQANLLLNGDFESASNDWISCGGNPPVAADTGGAAGTAGIQLTGQGCLYQEFPVTAGQPYTLSCQARSATGYSSMSLSTSDAFFEVIESDVAQVLNTDYSVLSLSFIAPAEAARGVVTLYADNTADFDNCVVSPGVVDPEEPVEPPDNAGNLLANGDFENGLSFWFNCGTEDGADASAASAQLSNRGCLYQEFPVTTGETYVMRCVARSEADYTSMELTMSNASFQPLVSSSEQAVLDATFTEYQVAVAAPEGSAQGVAVLYADTAGEFDNCEVYAGDLVPPPPVDPETAVDVLTNGDFEDDLNGWNLCGGNPAITNNGVANSQAATLDVDACLYQEFRVTPGNDYKLNCTASADSGYSSVQLAMSDVSYAQLEARTEQIIGSELQTYSTTLTAPETAQYGVVTLYTSSSASFDNCGINDQTTSIGNDRDGDGVVDSEDVFPDDPTESRDSDNDGVGDNADAFPTDATETVDSDNDGVGDNADAFPIDPARSNEGEEAWYRFDNDTSDATGNFNAVPVGAPTYADGIQNQALVFTGENHVLLPTVAIQQREQITLSAWVYWEGGDAWQRVFDFGNNTEEFIYLTPSSDAGTLQFKIKNGGNVQVLNAPALVAEQWSHVAITLDGQIGRLYVNGQPASEAAISLTPADIAPTLNYLGRSQFTGPLFQGMMDDFRIYSEALSAQQVRDILADSFAADAQLINSVSASQSSTGSGGVATRAIDGYTNGNYFSGTVTHTNNERNAWWQSDLGALTLIDKVVLHNRTDCCTDRLSDFTVFVSDKDMSNRSYADLMADTGIARAQVNTLNGSFVEVPLPALGRFVKVQLAGTNVLSLAEVEIYGKKPATGSACDGFCLIDNFDDRVNGSIRSQGDWQTNPAGSLDGAVVTDRPPEGFNGKALSNDPNGVPFRGNAYKPLNEFSIPNGASGTLFFQVLAEDLNNTYSHFGMTDLAAPRLTDNGTGVLNIYSDFEVQMSLDHGRMRVRNGSNNTYLSNINVDTGVVYNIWMVANNQTDTFEIYVQGGSQQVPVKGAASDGRSVFPFRHGTNGPLQTLYLINSPDNVDTGTVYTDNFYMDVGSENLTLPLPTLPPSAFSEVETFDDLTLGSINGQNQWQADSANASVGIDPTNAANLVMTIGTGAVDAHKSIPAIDNGSTGTVFFRMRRAGVVNANIGLSDVANPAEYEDFENQINQQNTSQLYVRDAGVFDATGPISDNGWYCVWMVTNNPLNTYQVYMQGDGAIEPALLSAGTQNQFRYRNGSATNPLTQIFLRHGNGSGTVYIDDIYVSSDSVNLSNPSRSACDAAGGTTPTQPLSDPIPERITASGLTVRLEDFATMPASSGGTPRARINYLGHANDNSGRVFVNDLRNSLYVIENGNVSTYLNVRSRFPNFADSPGLGSGFGFFTFHPEFASNGLFYTVHTEAGSALSTVTPDFTSPSQDSMQGVITEWRADDPAASTFSGSSREVLRIGFDVHIHNFQQIDFNPTAQPGDEDYGLLYLAAGDGQENPNFTNLPLDLTYPHGKILRIDPLGNNSANGQYGIPASNPFLSTNGALGEIWAYGLRNPHRFSWDSEGTNKMFIGHIGEKNIDGIYPGFAGANYGWNAREGSFLFKRNDPNNVYPLPDNDADLGYTYPVAEYDHDEGFAAVGGFVYRGDAIPELQGKYVFGDIANGRIFYTEESDMITGETGTVIRELKLQNTSGAARTMRDFAGSTRAGLRLGMDAQGELYFLSKTNGKIWRVIASDNTNNLPVLIDLNNFNNAPGENVNTTIVATDDDNDNLSFSATGLPPGVTMNNAGVLSGTATAEGTYTVTVTVVDGNGGSTIERFDWTISHSGGGNSGGGVDPGGEVAGGIFEIASNGLWTWYNDERAIYHNGFLFVGYVRTDGDYGITRYSPYTGERSETIISTSRSRQRDDHNNPSITTLPDGRLLAVYAKHGVASEYYYRISNNAIPATLDDWGSEMIKGTPSATTYAHTYRLEGENNKIYNFFRSFNLNPSLTLSTDNGNTWGAPINVIYQNASGNRPYTKYVSNNVDRIDLTYTDGHPRFLANSLYHLYYKDGAFRATDGTVIKQFEDLPLNHPAGERGTVVYQYSSSAWGPSDGPDQWIPSGRAWTWDTGYQLNGDPVTVFQVSKDVNDNFRDTRIFYYYARWNGQSWQKRLIAQGGRPTSDIERDYGGGMAIDPVNPNIVYISSNAANPSDISSIDNVALNADQRYEILKGVTSDGGLTFSWTPVTSDSTSDNLRPIVPQGHGSLQHVIWYDGTYNHGTSFDNNRIMGYFDETIQQPPVPVAGVTIDQQPLDIFQDASYGLTASVLPVNATVQTVNWTSGNNAIATVDSNGNVTGQSLGTTTITASSYDGSQTATLQVNVVPDNRPKIKLDFNTPSNRTETGFTALNAEPNSSVQVNGVTATLFGHQAGENRDRGIDSDLLTDFAFNDGGNVFVGLRLEGLAAGTYQVESWHYDGDPNTGNIQVEFRRQGESGSIVASNHSIQNTAALVYTIEADGVSTYEILAREASAQNRSRFNGLVITTLNNQ